MTRDDIIRMAAEAGITPWVHHQWVGGNKFVHADEGMDGDLACLMQFAALVAAAEREAVIGICEEWAKSGAEFPLLDAIRARGENA